MDHQLLTCDPAALPYLIDVGTKVNGGGYLRKDHR